MKPFGGWRVLEVGAGMRELLGGEDKVERRGADGLDVVRDGEKSFTNARNDLKLRYDR